MRETVRERGREREREREKYRERDGEPPEYIVSYRSAQSKLLLWFFENRSLLY